MTDTTANDISNKQYCQQYADSRINKNKHIAAQESGDVEFQQPAIGDMNQRLKQHGGETRKHTHDDTQQQQENPVVDVLHAPHDKSLVYALGFQF